MYTKTRAAFIMTGQRMFDIWPEIYFWTFTFKKVYPDDWAMYFWKQLCRNLSRRFPMLQGVRVVEVHPGGHGLHFHALLNMRVPMWYVQHYGWKYGFGRCFVEVCDRNTCLYLAKYLSKEHELAKGARHWGTIGGLQQCKVGNVRCDSVLSHNMTALQTMISNKRWVKGEYHAQPVLQIDYTSFRDLAWLTRLHGSIENWPGTNFELSNSLDKRTYHKQCRVIWKDGCISAVLPSHKVEYQRARMAKAKLDNERIVKEHAYAFSKPMESEAWTAEQNAKYSIREKEYYKTGKWPELQ